MKMKYYLTTGHSGRLGSLEYNNYKPQKPIHLHITTKYH